MVLILIHSAAKRDRGDQKLMISPSMNETEFCGGGIPCVITSIRALSIAAISSDKGVIMSIVSYLKILSLMRDAVQRYFVFNLCQFYAADSSCTLKSPCHCRHRGCWDQGLCQWGKQGINPTLWMVLGARVVLNIVSGVTGKRKYFANSKMTSAVSELFPPTSLFLISWECHGR